MNKNLTPEAHTNALAAALDIELDRYGAASLTDFVTSTIDARVDEERPDYQYWVDVRKAFEAASDVVRAINRRHGRNSDKGTPMEAKP